MRINPTIIKSYADGITGIINTILVPLLISVAFAFFLWGIYKYFIKGATSETEKGEGRQFALWGIIGFVILFSVWGIVQIFMGTLGLDDSTKAPKMPIIGGSSSSGLGDTAP